MPWLHCSAVIDTTMTIASLYKTTDLSSIVSRLLGKEFPTVWDFPASSLSFLAAGIFQRHQGGEFHNDDAGKSQGWGILA